MLATENNARWGILLAGGEGTRMRPLIRSWIGENRPKQYCTFVGSRSMFQHTVACRFRASWELAVLRPRCIRRYRRKNTRRSSIASEPCERPSAHQSTERSSAAEPETQEAL